VRHVLKKWFYKQLKRSLNNKLKFTSCIMGRQVNFTCELSGSFWAEQQRPKYLTPLYIGTCTSFCHIIAQRDRLWKNEQYLKLDPEASDLTIIKIIKVWTEYRCNDIRRIMVSKWKINLTSSAGFPRNLSK